VRVIAGIARGRELRAPPGLTTRPTSDRLRESLFAMLEAADVEMTETLDLYAGSGALGIEALSRGAERCTFVEEDARACATARENLRRVGLEERGRVQRGRVGRWHTPDDRAWTLVLADPPYDDAASWAAIEHTVADALAEGAVLAVEHAARSEPPAALAGLPLWRDRRQGNGAVALYREQGAGAASGESAGAAGRATASRAEQPGTGAEGLS
jgi:16S rRNA (guanine966-N2)-methyltransferase